MQVHTKFLAIFVSINQIGTAIKIPPSRCLAIRTIGTVQQYFQGYLMCQDPWMTDGKLNFTIRQRVLPSVPLAPSLYNRYGFTM